MCSLTPKHERSNSDRRAEANLGLRRWRGRRASLRGGMEGNTESVLWVQQGGTSSLVSADCLGLNRSLVDETCSPFLLPQRELCLPPPFFPPPKPKAY